MDNITLVSDNYLEIFKWITDKKTLYSWMLVCKKFNQMVTDDVINMYFSPHLVKVNGYWDGPLSGTCLYHDKMTIFYMSRDHDIIYRQDYPKRLWDLIANTYYDNQGYAEIDDIEFYVLLGPEKDYSVHPQIRENYARVSRRYKLFHYYDGWSSKGLVPLEGSPEFFLCDSEFIICKNYM